MYGKTVDPKEIDDNGCKSGPRKPSEGKTKISSEKR